MSKAIRRAGELQRVRAVPRLARRAREGHKGDYGHVLVVGGSRGMSGAVALAAQSALRGGAGVVTFAAPEAVQLAIATMCPCATSIALSCKADGEPDAAAVRQVLQAAASFGRGAVLAVGPGMGVGAGQQSLVRAALEQERPLVLDADGLNNLAKIDGWPALRRCPMVLTPHPGEFSRLTGRTVAEIQADRIGSAVAAAREWGGAAESPLVLVLKGAGTVVSDGRRVYVNTTGNPGMATGGSGDVLTGLLAALLWQPLAAKEVARAGSRERQALEAAKPAASLRECPPCFDAACLGVYVHGLAGDLAARELGEVSLVAWDLIDYLPPAMKRAGAELPAEDGS